MDLEQEIIRLKSGNFTEEEFQNLCHTFTEEDACRFKRGCTAYQEKLFGKTKNKIIAIGVMGDYRCFFNKTIEESKLEYRKELLTQSGFNEENIDEYIENLSVEIIEFDDRFDVYDISN